MWNLLRKLIPRKIRREGEQAAAEWFVGEHRREVLEAYDAARLDGASEHDAVIAACRRMITHAL